MLPAASSLLSSRWARDNLVTSDPTRLYSGAVLETLDIEALRHLIGELEQRRGPVQPEAAVVGVFTWDISCAGGGDPFMLQLPLVLDEPGRRGRSKRHVPRLNVENIRHFIGQGLDRFLVPPRELVTLGGNVVAAIFPVLADYHPATFGQGAIRVDLYQGKASWAISLGREATADVLAEMVAGLVYHYEPDASGGTAVTDVFVNDGDFLVKRRTDGSFDVRLRTIRRREPGIGPSLLLLYLVQLMGYEDWCVGQQLIGVPVLLSNPSIAFEGVVRGLRYRYRDLGGSDEQAMGDARRWIRDFGRSREGRAYRPWVERFLAGQLPLSFGDDLRERWWRTVHLQQRLGVLELRARFEGASEQDSSVQAFRSLLGRLRREIGSVADPSSAGALEINDLGRDGIFRLLADARVSPPARNGVADALLRHWPYPSLDHLLGKVPDARGLRRLKSRLSFGHVTRGADEGTLKSLQSSTKRCSPSRLLANAEVFGELILPFGLEQAAMQVFPTFEQYMDSALHDETWGYYAHHVMIGHDGHFTTNPECLSPHYGRWLAARAFSAWKDLVAHGDLGPHERFSLIEFGAGNGRLALDVMDGIAGKTAHDAAGSRGSEPTEWQRFAANLEYKIYETSPSLRAKQRQLLGDRVTISQGDARCPAATLNRDFPRGLKGLVVTNEVPDAFGVHKVVLTREGRALVALVVPRVESRVQGALGESLRGQVANANDQIRATFGFGDNADDYYLDKATYAQLMEALAQVPSSQREGLREGIWFEEVYVPAASVETLRTHLSVNAAQYAIALAAEDSGVVLYMNTHADRFMQELGSALAAGFVVTIDYGSTAWGLVDGARCGEFLFRVYCDGQEYVPLPNDPYSRPGAQDMTADVNFTALARAGQQVGLSLIHYGPERDISGDAFPALLAAAEQEEFAEFIGCPVFKVLVLGTRDSSFFDGPFVTALPLEAREQDVPKSRRQRIVTIEQTLRRGT